MYLEYVPIVALKNTFQPPLSCVLINPGSLQESIYSITDVHYTINPKAVPKKEETVHGSVPSAAYTGFLFQRWLRCLGPEPFQDLQKVNLIVEEAPVLEKMQLKQTSLDRPLRGYMAKRVLVAHDSWLHLTFNKNRTRLQ